MNCYNTSREVLLTLFVILIIGLAGCKDGNNSGSETTPDPEITSVNPTEGPVGTSVTIEGSGFSSTTSENVVSFNGTSANVSSATSSQIQTQVPEGATSGAVSVSVNGNTATGPAFTIEEAMPGIQSVEPDSGLVGTEITITGMNFSATASENTITFNGVTAPVTSASETELVTEVPDGAEDGPIELTVNNEVATFNDFNVITTGALEVIITTTGFDLDNDGFLLAFGLEETLNSDNNETLTLANIEQGTYELELQEVDKNCTVSEGENLREITITPGDTTSTAFNVDCREAIKNQIVFISDRSGAREMYVMNTDGTEVQQLTDNTLFKSDPSISPDGTKIAFIQNENGVNTLYVIDAAGNNIQSVIDYVSRRSGAPSWSPDGTKLLIVDDRDGNTIPEQDIFSINIDGTGLQPLTDNSEIDSYPEWSPDGQKILLTSTRDGNEEIFQMNADGSNIQQITNTESAGNISARWSPDGSQIAFISDRDSDNDFELYVMNADGSDISQITSNTDFDFNPGWSPDGSKLNFITNRDTDFEIYQINADGSGTATNISNFSSANELGIDRSPIE